MILNERQRSMAVAVVGAALVLEIMDGSIINVAIPQLQQSLGASGPQIGWVSSGYAFFFAALLIAGGRLGDILGYRRMFMAGMTGFGLASAGCGLAGSAEMLIAMRILQGAAAAMMGPQVLSIVQVLYAPHERFKVMGIFGLIGGAAGILGPIIGGLLMRLDLFGLGWRPIFLVNVPVVALALVLARRVLPKGGSAEARGLDGKGLALALPGLAALLFPLIEGPRLGWPPPLRLLPLLAVLLLVLCWRHLRQRAAANRTVLVPPALFGDGLLLTGLAMVMLYTTGTGALLLSASVALQRGLGFDVLQTALIHIPFAAGAAFSIALLGRRLLPILGRRMMLIGAASQICGLLLLSEGMAAADLWRIGVGFALCGSGMGLISAPLPAFCFVRVPPAQAGAASGLFTTCQQLGMALGVATLGTAFLAALDGGADPARAFATLALWQIGLLVAVAALSRLIPARAHLAATTA
ncbi:MFS transporter [Paracoccus sp. MA]|uniref:MFS transporter n=1 Tax=Paracoccus sp. MA TaxID=2895796 RepID=UPI001E58F5F6|nr:MFS transporter [Paracoccus sp. MA]UFM64163.1 MFS transporter [Paracoccus sp. MA]